VMGVMGTRRFVLARNNEIIANANTR
jgi:hypothetical protein